MPLISIHAHCETCLHYDNLLYFTNVTYYDMNEISVEHPSFDRVNKNDIIYDVSLFRNKHSNLSLPAFEFAPNLLKNK